MLARLLHLLCTIFSTLSKDSRPPPVYCSMLGTNFWSYHVLNPQPLAGKQIFTPTTKCAHLCRGILNSTQPIQFLPFLIYIPYNSKSCEHVFFVFLNDSCIWLFFIIYYCGNCNVLILVFKTVISSWMYISCSSKNKTCSGSRGKGV